MSNLTKFEGWDLDVSDTSDPRVRDVDIAKHAGLAKPADIRRVIDRNWSELTAQGEIRVIALEAKTSGGRPGTEYRLNEVQAVLLMMFLKTDRAKKVRGDLAQMFVAYRRGLLAAPTTVSLDIVHGARIGDVPSLRAEASNMCASVAKAAHVSLRRVHGWIRRTFKVPGIHHLGVAIWPTVKEVLFQLLLGKLAITTGRALPPPNPRQLRMFEGGKA